MSAIYNIVALVITALILLGIRLMSSPRTAVRGNLLSASGMLAAVILVLAANNITDLPLLWAGIAAGGIIGYLLAAKVAMIRMPQLVALFNGFGGGASALVALVEIIERSQELAVFSRSTGQLALVVGGVTLSGSLIAAAKLDHRLPQQPIVIRSYRAVTGTALAVTTALLLLSSLYLLPAYVPVMSLLTLLLSFFLGSVFALRVGGADMPITISLLNSFSGLAGAIVGLTIGEPLLVSVGAIVGASGLILTRLMCTAMNRSLLTILAGETVLARKETVPVTATATKTLPSSPSPAGLLRQAGKVIIVPGYGLAAAQAQSQLKQVADLLEQGGAEVKFAIHPVAGRMPGHMNVLLAEADVPYDKLCEMNDINPEFKDADLVLVVGASDVVNPAANTAEGTPIYGMPVLNVEEAGAVIVCNLDDKPGYSGVPNTLYKMPHVTLLAGNAARTLAELAKTLAQKDLPAEPVPAPETAALQLLRQAKKVIIVPGYGLAAAQAQSRLKQVSDLLEQGGAEVKFAIHPVAGRMPGHMNVLLAEADVPYDKLCEMNDINPEFKDTDLVLVVGASDVVNPAANTAEGTPIYGMPVLNVEEAGAVIVCNLDDKPGYSGVPNTLYEMPHVTLLAGNAAHTLAELAARLK